MNPKAPKNEYRIAYDEVEARLGRILEALAAHKSKAGASPNWGHVGDLNRLDSDLAEIEAYMTGTGEYAE